ncbi:MAG: hypothetical protein ABIY70_07535 [Capsulimonas sp.]|uniref:hypothetical protein n=1 Tax=Capsulimonas sp. TaxID=2494211 RepID=UPI003264ACD2
MTLTIDDPQIEIRLQEEADRRGISVAAYAAKILGAALAQTPSSPPDVRFAPADEWIAHLYSWANNHPTRQPLPDNAFDRASFYEN